MKQSHTTFNTSHFKYKKQRQCLFESSHSALSKAESLFLQDSKPQIKVARPPKHALKNRICDTALVDTESSLNKQALPQRRNIKTITYLKNSFEFDIVFKSKVFLHKDFITIHALLFDDFVAKLITKKRYCRDLDSTIMLGFSINKKVAKACKRNLIRRRIKAIIHKAVIEKRISDVVFVFVCRKGSTEIAFNDLEKYLLHGIRRLLQTLHHKRI